MRWILPADSTQRACHLLRDRVSDVSEFQAPGPARATDPREHEVPELMAEGRSGQEIAARRARRGA